MDSNLIVAIAVVGVANTGKTTTIDLVRQKLLEDGWKETCRIKFKSSGIIADEKSIMKKDGVVIAFCPRGDSPKEVEEGFEYAINHDADIILYARRTKGKVDDVIAGYQKGSNFKSIEIEKKSISSNEAKKQELLGVINDSIKDIR